MLGICTYTHTHIPHEHTYEHTRIKTHTTRVCIILGYSITILIEHHPIYLVVTGTTLPLNAIFPSIDGSELDAKFTANEFSPIPHMFSQ